MLKLVLAIKADWEQKYNFSFWFSYTFLPFRLLMQFIFVLQTKQMSSESCVSREERQMVLCKVDSVVSSGEMNEFPPGFARLASIQADIPTSSHTHCNPWPLNTGEQLCVCEDVFDILGGNRGLICQKSFVILHGNFWGTSCETTLES